MLYRELQYVKKKVMLCVACMKNNFDTTFTWQSALAREARVRGLVGERESHPVGIGSTQGPDEPKVFCGGRNYLLTACPLIGDPDDSVALRMRPASVLMALTASLMPCRSESNDTT